MALSWHYAIVNLPEFSTAVANMHYYEKYRITKDMLATQHHKTKIIGPCSPPWFCSQKNGVWYRDTNGIYWSSNLLKDFRESKDCTCAECTSIPLGEPHHTQVFYTNPLFSAIVDDSEINMEDY